MSVESVLSFATIILSGVLGYSFKLIGDLQEEQKEIKDNYIGRFEGLQSSIHNLEVAIVGKLAVLPSISDDVKRLNKRLDTYEHEMRALKEQHIRHHGLQEGIRQ